ncbi:hypothetical protein [Massilia sp. TSP1-1-2]|uniref:hypothetical protein n=1 Tax=Massilia sp. TSP1-1-2 TaxID=2804649 RepID=UPI003CECFE7F
MERRQFVKCAACALAVRSGPVAADSVSHGCFLIGRVNSHHGLNPGPISDIAQDQTLLESSGDSQLDKLLGRALARASARFEVAPSFSFYRDSDGMNACATPDTRTSGTWGSVLFGRELFDDLLSRYQDNGIAVIAIAAHEFAHILQFKHALGPQLEQGEPTVRRSELHADYVAGWYLGVMKRRDPTISLWSAGDTFRRIGDYAFNKPSHHGTPSERIAASQAGFALASRGAAKVGDALNEGLRYMRHVRLEA